MGYSIIGSKSYENFAKRKRPAFLHWEKGNQNEIDLVAITDMKKELVVAEVKLNKDKIDIEVLKQKSRRISMSYPKYKIQYLSLGFEDANGFAC